MSRICEIVDRQSNQVLCVVEGTRQEIVSQIPANCYARVKSGFRHLTPEECEIVRREVRQVVAA